MPRCRFDRVQLPGVHVRRFLDQRSSREWDCIKTALFALRDGERAFQEDANLPDGGYYFEACGFTIWFTAPVLGEVAAVTQIRYLPDLPG